MMQHSSHARERTGMFLLLALLAIIFVAGGSNRGDTIAQIFVRSGAIIVGGITLLRLGAGDLRPVRTVMLFVLAYLALALVQLVPLPPAVWTAPPMRNVFAETATVVGLAQPWRPISLVPEATVNSALACLPVLCVIACVGMVRTRSWPTILAALVGFTLLSGIVGLLQITTGGFYFYGGNEGAVGLLANRNHQAALLAAAVPAIAVLAAFGPRQIDLFWRNTVALALVLFLIPLSFVTGSRAGLILMLVGLAAAVTLGFITRGLSEMREASRPARTKTRWRSRLGLTIGGGAVLAAIASTIFLSRAVAVQRLLAKDLEGDLRLILFQPMLNIASKTFPFGTGLGSFASIFKVYEPEWALSPFYFNHAHNDLMEIAIESGLLGLFLVAAFLLWWGVTTLRVWRMPARDMTAIMARLGTVQTFIFMLASLSDYPLRVPIGQLVFALGCCFMAIAVHRHTRTVAASNALDAKVTIG